MISRLQLRIVLGCQLLLNLKAMESQGRCRWDAPASSSRVGPAVLGTIGTGNELHERRWRSNRVV